jgi:hypothetical protein
MGVRDYANPGKGGLFILDYNVFLNANSYYNRHGDKADAIQEPVNTIPLDVDISGYVNGLMLAYATPKLEFSGNTQYIFVIAPNYTTAIIGVGLGELPNGETIEGGASGIGDLAIAPLMLSCLNE